VDTADVARANRTKPRDDDDDDDGDDGDDDDDVPKPRRSSYTWDVLYIERERHHRTPLRARDIDRSAKRAHCELHSRHKVVLSMLVITSTHTTYLYMEYETPHSKTDLAERERER